MRNLLPLLLLAVGAPSGQDVSLEDRLLATLPAESASKEAGPDLWIAFRPDGGAVGYVDFSTRTVVAGPQKLTPAGSPLRPAWSLDGRVFAYVDLVDGKSRVVVGGQASDLVLDGAPLEGPLLNHDGSAVAYLGRAGGKNVAVVGSAREEIPMIGGVDAVARLAMSADGRHFAYVVSGPEFKARWVVADGVKGPEFQDVGQPAFGPDGRVVYGATRHKTYAAVIVTGTEAADVPKVSDVMERVFLGPDGRVRAYTVANSPAPLTIDGRKVRRDKNGPDGDVDALAVSADGKTLAYRQWKSQRRGIGPAWIVVPGSASESFESAGRPVINAAGKIAYAAKAGGRWFVVAGAARSEEFDFVWDPVFSADGTKIAFGARKGAELWWKVLEVR